VNVRNHKPVFARLRGTARPHLSHAAERLVVVGNDRRRKPVPSRDALVELCSLLGLLLVAVALPWMSGADAPPADVTIALVAAIALVSRVEFQVGAGVTYPLQIVFLPALFLVDPAWAPAVVATGLVLGSVRDIAHESDPRRRLYIAAATAGNAWFAVGPALVLTLAGVQELAWEHWPVYVLALASQFFFDTATGVAREWAILGVQPRLQLRLTGLVFLVDLLLTPIGLMAALVAQDQPLAFLLVLPLAALLRVFARERAARIDQAIELSAAYRGTALLLGEVIAHDDQYTGEHSYGVISLSLEIADELGLDEDDRRLVEFGALLHDVGKIAVPKEIVNKPGPLDDDEWAVMRQHTIAGQRMLDKIGGGMTEVGAIVRASHERWDGEGYPDGRAGEDVPLPARIVSVADAFSAITTTRPYRRAQSADAAIRELRRCAGTQFDPEVIDALVAVLERPAAETPAEFFQRTAEREPPSLTLVPDIDKILEEQLGRALSRDDGPHPA
jgi:putative nucleotidyltransferase with HDIG domain